MVNSVAFKRWLTHSTSICSGVQESKLTDLTRDMCTPRLRWIPAQRMHINTPRFQDAQRGPRMAVTQTEPNTVSLTGPVPFQLTLSPPLNTLHNNMIPLEWLADTYQLSSLCVPFAIQSAQYLLSSSLNRSIKIVWCFS